MKKLFSVLLVLAATINVMAISYTAGAKVRITSADNKTCDLYLITSDDLNEGVNPTYCGEIYLPDYPVALYGIYGGTNYQTFGTKTMNEFALGLKTNASTTYTLEVLQVLGTGTLNLFDQETNTYTPLTLGATYPFTATASTTNNARFIINHAALATGICHRYGKLQVSGSIGQNVVVKNMDDSATSIGTVAITADYQEIDLAGLAAGQYKVEWNSQTLIIDVQ